MHWDDIAIKIPPNRFVPDLTDIPAFAELATAEGLGPEAVGSISRERWYENQQARSYSSKVKVAAGETLDEALATLAGNFSSSNQYFDLLVQVDNPSILCI